MKIFRVAANLLSVGLLVAAAFHISLLSSDSSSYRTWVYVQILLLVFGAWILWESRKLHLRALIGFAVVSLPIIYINAIYLNYGNGYGLWLFPLLGWCAYCGLALLARADFRRSGTASGANGA